MSGVEVVAAVSAVVSAFHAGSELLKHIKAKRRKARAQAQQEFEEKQLQDSLVSGEQQIGFRYTQDMREMGEVVRVGDTIARERLMHVVVMLQMEIIKSLQMAAQHETAILNLRLLHEASITNRKDTFVILDEMKQRIIMTRHIPRQLEGGFDQRSSIVPISSSWPSNFKAVNTVPEGYIPSAVSLASQEEAKESRSGLARYFQTKRSNSATSKSAAPSTNTPTETPSINYSAAFEQLVKSRGEDRATIMKDIDEIMVSYKGLNISDKGSDELWGQSRSPQPISERRGTLDVLNGNIPWGNDPYSHSWDIGPSSNHTLPQSQGYSEPYPTFNQNVFSGHQQHSLYVTATPYPHHQAQTSHRYSDSSISSAPYSDRSWERNNAESSRSSYALSDPRYSMQSPPLTKSGFSQSASSNAAFQQHHDPYGMHSSPLTSYASTDDTYTNSIQPLSVPQRGPLRASPQNRGPANAPNLPQETVSSPEQASLTSDSQRAARVPDAIAPFGSPPASPIPKDEDRADTGSSRSSKLPPSTRGPPSSHSSSSGQTMTFGVPSTPWSRAMSAPTIDRIRQPSIASTDSSGSGSVGILPRPPSVIPSSVSTIPSSTIQSPIPGQERMMVGRPCKDNNYWGFCKGAWDVREDTKKGLALRTMPSGMYNTREIWECRRCNFRGNTYSLVHHGKKDKRETIVDPNIHTSKSGVRYRWIFLAKSHVKKKSPDSANEECNYGCIICSVEMKVTSIFGNVDTLMFHLLEHVAGMTQAAMKQTRCIVGRIARAEEDWDINVPLFADVSELPTPSPTPSPSLSTAAQPFNRDTDLVKRGATPSHIQKRSPTPDSRTALVGLKSVGKTAEATFGTSEGLDMPDMKRRRKDDRTNEASGPPTTIEQALSHQNIEVLQQLLKTQFDVVAQGEYCWLHELVEVGYTYDEVAEILYEKANDAPWIFFEPSAFAPAEVSTDMHLPGCAHQFSSAPDLSATWPQLYSRPDNWRDTIKTIEELCGLAGVTPITRDVQKWNGSVTFEEQNTVATVTCSQVSDDDETKHHAIMSRLKCSLERFCRAVGHFQTAKLCCDSFTILWRASHQQYPSEPSVEVCRVEFSLALQMLSELEGLADIRDIRPAELLRISNIVAPVLRPVLRGSKVDVPANNVDDFLLVFSLVIQIMCLGLLSYAQAHVGAIRPFFLDSPLKKIRLLGSQASIGEHNWVEASLNSLTCFGNMIQSQVLAFHFVQPRTIAPIYGQEPLHDLRTNSQDLLDTWGPGHFLVDPTSKVPFAIKIGNGFVYASDLTNNKFHWSRDVSPENISRVLLDPQTQITIGTSITVNENCRIDANNCWVNSSASLQPLGPHRAYWTFDEKQFGIQAGNYGVLQGVAAFHKVPGQTLKQHRLQLSDEMLIPFLNDLWGVQVSFCTRVARRVPLRDMVADLLPVFAMASSSHNEIDIWNELTKLDMINAFQQDRIRDWLITLSPELYQHVLRMIRRVFEVLQHTGLDRERKNLLVAWPQECDLFRCFRIPCEKDNSWFGILAESEDSATFAYITTKCFETTTIKCSGPSPTWKDAIPLLETAVVLNSANSSRSLASLQHNATYYFQKLDHLFFVKVYRPQITGVAKLIASRSRSPFAYQQRLILRLAEDRRRQQARLRERIALGDTAEEVAVSQ